MYGGRKSLGLIVCVVFIFHGNFGRSEEEYCDMKSCSSVRNTLCSKSESGLASDCTDVKDYPLSPTDIVNDHNSIRTTIARGRAIDKNRHRFRAAANMREIRWDDKLAKAANQSLYHCLKGNDPCAAEYSFGQNIGTKCDASASTDRISEIMYRVWLEELPTSFDTDDIPFYRYDPKTSNATQLIWADTSLVGCSAVTKQRCTILLCMYETAGNQVGKPIYKRTRSIYDCPNGPSENIKFKDLCK